MLCHVLMYLVYNLASNQRICEGEVPVHTLGEVSATELPTKARASTVRGVYHDYED